MFSSRLLEVIRKGSNSFEAGLLVNLQDIMGAVLQSEWLLIFWTVVAYLYVTMFPPAITATMETYGDG
jgi:hypothetical protein